MAVANRCQKDGVLGFARCVHHRLECCLFLFKYREYTAAYCRSRGCYRATKLNAPIETIAQSTNSPKALADFYRTFPTESAIPDTLAEINRLAAKQGIYLNSGDYKLNKIKVQRGTASTPVLTQYEMVLPLESSYPSIRALTVSILHQLPSVAVSDIQMMRDSTLSPFIEAKLVLVLFVRGD